MLTKYQEEFELISHIPGPLRRWIVRLDYGWESTLLEVIKLLDKNKLPLALAGVQKIVLSVDPIWKDHPRFDCLERRRLVDISQKRSLSLEWKFEEGEDWRWPEKI